MFNFSCAWCAPVQCLPITRRRRRPNLLCTRSIRWRSTTTARANSPSQAIRDSSSALPFKCEQIDWACFAYFIIYIRLISKLTIRLVSTFNNARVHVLYISVHFSPEYSICIALAGGRGAHAWLRAGLGTLRLRLVPHAVVARATRVRAVLSPDPSTRQARGEPERDRWWGAVADLRGSARRAAPLCLLRLPLLRHCARPPLARPLLCSQARVRVRSRCGCWLCSRSFEGTRTLFIPSSYDSWESVMSYN